MLSMCQFERVLELLGAQKLHIQAGLLLQACQEFGIFSPAARSTDILLKSQKIHYPSQECYCDCNYIPVKVWILTLGPHLTSYSLLKRCDRFQFCIHCSMNLLCYIISTQFFFTLIHSRITGQVDVLVSLLTIFRTYTRCQH